VIHELNGTPVTSIAALRDAMDKRQPGSALVLQVERDGKLSYQTLDIE
jgi:S1-C subfamily serine protease